MFLFTLISDRGFLRNNANFDVSYSIIFTEWKLYDVGHQKVFVVNNSQNYCAYAENALLTTHINLNSGDKQACMRDSWYMQDGQHISQLMIYFLNHLQFSDMSKERKAVF